MRHDANVIVSTRRNREHNNIAIAEANGILGKEYLDDHCLRIISNY